MIYTKETDMELVRGFIDTNIGLYAFIETEDKQKHHIAKQLILNTDVFISSQVFNEMCINLLRKTEMNEHDIQSLI